MIPADIFIDIDDFGVKIHKFNWTGNWGTYRQANYDGAITSTFDAYWQSTFWPLSTDVRYSSDSLDVNWINKSGVTKYAILHDWDVANSPPDAADTGQSVSFYSANSSIARVPYLIITTQMASNVSKKPLSESVDGQQILVAATSSPGTIIHMSTFNPEPDYEILHLFAANIDTVARDLVIEWGGTTITNATTSTISAQRGYSMVITEFRLNNNAYVRAYGSAANKLVITGYVLASAYDPVFGYDTFTESATTVLSSHVGELATWAEHPRFSALGKLCVNTLGRVRHYNSGEAVYYYNFTPPSANYKIETDIYKASNSADGGGDSNCQLFLRLAGNDYGSLRAYTAWNNDYAGWRLLRYDGGNTYTLLVAYVATTWTVGSTHSVVFRVHTNADSNPVLTLVDSGNTIFTYTDTSASKLTNAGWAGIGISSTPVTDDQGMQFNYFKVSDIA
jgi:hypothetical protein